MVAFSLLFFLLLASIVVAVGVSVALKTVDFYGACMDHFDKAEEQNFRIIRQNEEILNAMGGGEEVEAEEGARRGRSAADDGEKRKKG